MILGILIVTKRNLLFFDIFRNFAAICDGKSPWRQDDVILTFSAEST